MKKLLLIAFILFFQLALPAQFLSGYGVKAGLGFSNHSWNYSGGQKLEYDYKSGFSARLFAEFFDLKFFNAQVEAGYLRKGFNLELPVTTAQSPDETGAFIKRSGSLDYLSFSALAKLKFPSLVFTPYIIAGPQINFLLHQSADKDWDAIYDKFKKSNIDISIGAGTEIKFLLPVSFFIEYRFERDLNDNYDSPNIDIKNYSHVILAGVAF